MIDFKNVTYLIGLNAVGKTTIMDAIRYCLTTNKDFNTAGNKKSGRTLQGSVHQKQRAENSYLRPNHTVTYIGIEFLDDTINKNFVITVRVESENPNQELRHVSQDWYISKPGYILDDMPYFTTMKDGRRPSSREEFKLSNKGLDKAPTQAEAKRRICRVLGIGDADSPLGKKFNQVFHMGTSLEDINDIRKFIYTYILPEPEINVEILHKDMRELERLQEILEEAQQREKLLAKIIDRMREARELDAKVKINEALVSYAKFQHASERQQEEENKIIQAKKIIQICLKDIQDLEEKRGFAEQELFQAKKDADNSEENKAFKYLDDVNKSNNIEYKKLVNHIAIFDSAYDDLKKLKKQMQKMNIMLECNIEKINNCELLREERVEAIRICNKELAGFSELLKDNDASIRNQLMVLKQDVSDLVGKINKMRDGTMCYPKESELVRDAVNEKLIERGYEPEAKLFCELLYMNDEQWQDAVESYLNNQRFNIIVSPKRYDIAKEVFISMRDKVKGIGLVDTKNLMKKTKTINQYERSLAFTVESKNPYAKAYANFLMGNVICCDNSDDLEEHHKSVTKDCLRYQSFCLKRMKRQNRFIGIDALQQQLKTAEQELVEKRQRQNELDSQKEQYKILDKMYNTFVSGKAFDDLENYCEAKQKAEKLYDTIEEINEQIEEFKKNPLLQAMYNRVEECEKKHNNIIEALAEVKAKEKNARDDVKNAEIARNSLQRNLYEAKAEYEQITQTHAEYVDFVLNKYKEERRTKAVESIIYNFGNRIHQDKNAFNNYVNKELIPLQREYMGTYTCDYPEGLDGGNMYQMAFKSLVNIALEEHRNALKDAQIRCKERFRKEILFRMKDDILKAKQQFSQLRKVMDNLSYGEESYRFLIEGSKDKELNLFYNIIMDKDNQQIDEENEIMTFLAVNKSKALESQIDEFMQRIMVDVENRAQQNLTGKKNSSKGLSTYVDYRTYLDYDIIVKNTVTGLEVPLSKVSGDGSGGENQAPFYVAICASLLQIYQQSDNCIRLVLLDEAFNNMTSDRIEPMMKMFKDLKLQLVLIATPEKCTSIFPYCDITYSIVKYGSTNAITAFEGV